jgi:hypothetical protein
VAGRRRSTRRHRREPIRRRPLVREDAAEGPRAGQVAEAQTVPRPAPLLGLASLRRDLATSLALGLTMLVVVLVVAFVVE